MTTLIDDHGLPLIAIGEPMTFDDEGTLVETALRTDRTCEHREIKTYFSDPYTGGDGTILGMWACADCRIRFYPACRTCVDVGHRNIEHVDCLADYRASLAAEVGGLWALIGPLDPGCAKARAETLDAVLALLGVRNA